eukprot:11658591-Heterocapsa_arctica.AAC.1
MGLEDCKSVVTPAEHLSDAHNDTALLSPEDHRAYRRIISKVMYGSILRPDLAFVVKELARKLAAPT